MSGWLMRCGFDPGRLAYALRTAIAACLALLVAWLLGLEHPQWAAMTVWAASQPTRGQLLEKSFFRFAGTISGSVVGVLLVLAMTIHPALLVVGLALWVAACTGIGNLQRGFVSYGTMLAGYTAAMVALLDTAHPDHVVALGLDRMATVLTGVLVATLLGFAFAPAVDPGGLRARLRVLLADLLEHLADLAPPDGRAGALLSEMSAIEEGLEPHAAGSLRSRREVRATRAVLIAAMGAVLWRNTHETGPAEPQAECLRQAATALRQGDGDAAMAYLAAVSDPRLAPVLVRLAGAVGPWAQGARGPAAHPLLHPVALHRDWIGAREAALRAGGALLLFGGIWLATGWALGGYMMLGLSIMISLFSAFDNPAQMMRWVFTGQVLGVLGALACRWLVWPLAGSEFDLILLMIPFILFGPLLVGHRRTVATSFDYNMVMLLLLQPHWPLSGSVGHSVVMGMAVAAAPLCAWVVYLLVYPVSLRRRLGHLLTMMLNDLADIAGDPRAAVHRPIWQARLYHRALRLIRLSERSARAEGEALRAALAFLELSHAAMRCHEIAADPAANPATRRAAGLALARLRRIRQRPERTGPALARAGRLAGGEDAAVLRRAAEAALPATVGGLARA